MFIKLDELFAKENHRIERQVPIDWKQFRGASGEFLVLESKPVWLELYHSTKKCMKVHGCTKLVLGMMCDRCLKDVSVSFEIVFEKEIDCNHLMTEDNSDDTQYIVEGKLDLDKILRDEILLQWPYKVLCREDCKGICKVCGHDLNVSDCGCDRVVLDPRMAAIQDIFKNAE